MRIWDLDPSLLCRQHLLGEHRELHAIWTILTEDRDGYRQHPEVKRWEGKLNALYWRHEDLTIEMMHRGFEPKSDLDWGLAYHIDPQSQMNQTEFIDPPQRQREILAEKCDGCRERLDG